MSVPDLKSDGTVPLCHIVTPVGMLGYGLDELQTSNALQSLAATNIPTAIILDSGSTDSGPSKLALGSMSCPRSSYARDLAKLLKLVDTFRVPLIFSSAGGDGSDEHVKEILGVIEEIASQEQNEHYRLNTIAIFSGLKKELVLDRLRSGAISGCGPCVPQLTEEDLESTNTIVSQMGPEPFVDVMTANPDFNVIVGGRAYDPAPFIAYAWSLCKAHIDNASPEELQTIIGGFAHMGKVMECGGLCAEPKSPGAIATVYRNATFDITPLDPRARCTPTSVAAHALYEKSRPDVLHGPGGYLDLTSAKYEQLRDGRTVRVHGSLFYFCKSMGLPYQLKLEGATTIGYRTMYMGSVRDPILISQLDNLIERVKGYVAMQHCEVSGCWELDFHIYGRQGNASASDSGVFLIGEVLASSQHLATSVASTARIATIHGGYPGQKATAGNFAFGVGGKTEIELGACPKFSIYHLMNLQDGEEHLQPDCDTKAAASIFSQSVSVIGKGRAQQQQVSDNSLHPSQASAQDKTPPEERESDISQEDKTSSHNGYASPTKLVHLARVLRSKNAGPYEITLDVMFESEQVYRLVQQSDMLNLETVSDALKLPPKEIIWSGFFDPARAFKVTIPRVRGGKKVAAGSFMEDDVHGSQQHLGLVNMELPDSVLQGLTNLQGM